MIAGYGPEPSGTSGMKYGCTPNGSGLPRRSSAGVGVGCCATVTATAPSSRAQPIETVRPRRDMAFLLRADRHYHGHSYCCQYNDICDGTLGRMTAPETPLR